MAKETKQSKLPKLEDDDYTIGAFVVIGIIILLIVGIFLFVFNVIPGKNSDVVKCTSQSCFDKQYELCQPATWLASDPSESVTISYKITGKVGNNRCNVEFSSSAQKNVQISCDLEHTVSFAQAQTLAENNPKTYQCRKV